MEWHCIVNLTFSCLGISLLIYGLLIIGKIKRLFPKVKIMRYWVICSILIAFFVVGYSVNIFALIYDIHVLSDIIVSFVYFTGSIFVVGVLWISHLTYRLIKESAQD